MNNQEIIIEIIKQNIIHKIVSEPVSSPTLNDFIHSIKRAQKTVNLHLTEMLDMERVGADFLDDDFQGLEDSDEDFPCYSGKRKVDSGKIKKRIKK